MSSRRFIPALLVAVVLVGVPAIAWASVAFYDKGWEWQNPSPQGYELTSLAFTDSTNGHVAAKAATVIMNTADGGATWSRPTTDLATEMNDVWFSETTTQTGVAVGGGGRVLRTFDGGATWTDGDNNSNSESLFACSFVGLTGYAAGQSKGYGNSAFVKTTDGGATWVQHEIPSCDAYLSDIDFADEGNGVAVSRDGALLFTSTGGTSWTTTHTAWSAFWGCDAVSSTAAWAVGVNGTAAMYTEDGGANWRAVSIPGVSPYAEILYAVTFIDEDEGWVGGQAGQIFHTGDRGSTWQNRSLPVSSVVKKLDFVSETEGFAVAGTSIWHTVNGGVSWAEMSFGSHENLTDVDFGDADHGWAVGEAILRTYSGGALWKEQLTGVDLLAVDAVDAQKAYACGGGVDSTIMRTTDCGMNWTTTVNNLSPWEDRLTGIAAAPSDPSRVIAVGWAYDGMSTTTGTVMYSGDGGSSWTTIILNGTKALYCVDMVGTLDGFAGGADGTLLRTTDGGANWTSVGTTITQDITALDFEDASNGWIGTDEGSSGHTGHILKVTGGGATVVSGTEVPKVSDLSITDMSHVWTANTSTLGFGRTGFRWTADGLVWDSYDFGAHYPEFYGVAAASPGNRAWVVGTNGTILANFHAEMPLDSTPPAAPSPFTARPGDAKVQLAWPAAATEDSAVTRVFRSTADHAVSADPAAIGNASQTIVYEGASTAVTDTALVNGTTYYYTAFAKDDTGNWSAEATAQATPGPVSTTLVLAASPATVGYNGTSTLTGTLVAHVGAQDTSLTGQTVNVWRSLDNGLTYYFDGAATDVGGGRYTKSYQFVRGMKFYMSWDGDGFYPPVTFANTNKLTVLSKAYLYTPVAPSTMYLSRYYTIYGYVKPSHSSGTYLVTLKWYRRNSSGTYVYHHSTKAKRSSTSSGKTKYVVKTRLPHRGRWRVKAYHADVDHVATESGYDYVTAR